MRLVDLIQEEYERLLLKVTPTRILMLASTKANFSIVSDQNVMDIFFNLPQEKISGVYSVYFYYRIASVELDHRLSWHAMAC